MTALTIYQPNAVAQVLLDQRAQVAVSSMGGRSISGIPTLIVAKAAGGVGADFLVSLIDNCLRDAVGQPAYVLQIGGTQGLVAASHPRDLFKRIEVVNSDANAVMLDTIIERHAANPVIVMVDPNYSPRLMEGLDDLRAAGVSFNFRGILMVRNQSDHPSMMDLLAKTMPTWKAVIEPEFGEHFYGESLIVPRLPTKIAREASESKISVRDCLEKQSGGTVLSMLRSLKHFARSLEVIYHDR